MEDPAVNITPVPYTAEQKAAYVEQWKQSGKSQRAFAREQGLRFQSLNNWVTASKRKEKRVRRFTPEQRVADVEQWKESGKGQKEFCAGEGLSYKSLSNWHARLKREAAVRSKEEKPKKTKKGKRKPKGFVALKVKEEKEQPGHTEHSIDTAKNVFAKVEIAGRAVISLYREVPPDYLRSLVKG
jgi:transposase-like protein